MKNIGIIAEFNPFHNGHHYLIKQLKKDHTPDTIIVIMSGNLVQRGDLAIIDKWRRAKAAIDCGANLVLELPLPYACQNAELFTVGAFSVIKKINITHLGFGAENNHIDQLQSVADYLLNESESFKQLLKKNLDQGNAYPKALSLSLESKFPSEILQPNNILAMEYLKYIRKHRLDITPIPIKRIGEGYHSEKINAGYVSASAIRKACLSLSFDSIVKDVPPNALELLKSFYTEYGKFNQVDHLFNILKLYLITMSPYELSQIYDMSEGLENRMLKEIQKHSDYQTFLMAVKTKRYTQLKLQRLMLNIVLKIYQYTINHLDPNEIQCFKVLGFDSLGQLFLRKNANKVRFITKEKDYQNIVPTPTDQLIRDLTHFSSQLYYLALNQPFLNQEKVMNPYIKKSTGLFDEVGI